MTDLLEELFGLFAESGTEEDDVAVELKARSVSVPPAGGPDREAPASGAGLNGVGTEAFPGPVGAVAGWGLGGTSGSGQAAERAARGLVWAYLEQESAAEAGLEQWGAALERGAGAALSLGGAGESLFPARIGAEETARSAGRSAEGLYRLVNRARLRGGAEGQGGGVTVVRAVEPAPRDGAGAAMDVRDLDRAFQRDARRYDGGLGPL